MTTRRSFARATGLFALAAGTGALAPGRAGAQPDWPTKPIRLIVPFAPGGGTDLLARLLGPRLTERLGQSVVVENRPGANGIVGIQQLMAQQDQHAFGVISNGPLVVNPHAYSSLPYDPRQLSAVSMLATFPILLAVNPTVPAKNVEEFIAWSRARKEGPASYSSPGIGNSNHLAGELFASKAGTKLLHVPYKGSAPAVTALVSGEVDATFSSIPTILPFIRDGRVRVLGVGNAQRIAFMKDVPTIAEAGVPGYEFSGWYGLLAPAKTPRPIQERINAAANEAIRHPEMLQQFAGNGFEPLGGSIDAFRKYFAVEVAKWKRVIAEAGIGNL
jgi:tripartite-type tricarboxylate transporter receptor subunit TctC